MTQQHIIYLSRTGLLEPLGQSQVVSYVRGLSDEYSITVLSFEKSSDMADVERVQNLRDDCKRHNIDWRPLKYRKRPKYAVQFLSFIQMISIVLYRYIIGRCDLVHARSYVPGIVAWLINRLVRVPFIFDMRGLWPEELIVSKRISRGSFAHKLLNWLEGRMLFDAATVISLTEAGVKYLNQSHGENLQKKHIVVIPTCADLERFSPGISGSQSARPRVFGCIGSVLSGWFDIDLLSKFYEFVGKNDPDVIFDIVTRDDPALVIDALALSEQLLSRVKVRSSSSEEMPQVINGHDLNVMFYVGGEISELGRSPTRMAEVLGCGLPVIANQGVGDVENIISENNVGVILENNQPDDFASSLSAIDKLLVDREHSERCRKTAEEYFSLERGTEIYRAVYRQSITKAN
ncbi:glycosyltransferase [bacterium]|nr:glycosyltransferase [bacterium]